MHFKKLKCLVMLVIGPDLGGVPPHMNTPEAGESVESADETA